MTTHYCIEPGLKKHIKTLETINRDLVEACTNVTRVLQTEVIGKYLDIGVILTDEQWDKVGQAWAAIKKAKEATT